MKTFLSGISLQALVASMAGTLLVLAFSFIGYLDRSHDPGRFALLAGIGLLLVLAVLVCIVFFVRLSSLRAIIRRLEVLMERYFRDTPIVRPVPYNDECAQISFALQLLEESMDARERGEQELRRQERISVSILKALTQSVVVADSRGIITLFSPGAEAMLGYSAGEIIGKQTPMLFHDHDEVRRRAEELSEELCVPVVADTYTIAARALTTGQVDEGEWTYIRKDGSRLTVLMSIAVFFDDQGDIMCCCVATDVTERSRIQAEISRLANYDSLTQLPNRHLFHDRIHMAIIQARRKNAKFGLLMIDLDRFKPVNDQYGHSAGDILLNAVAGRMQKCLRESDTLARLGGDEFVAILPVIMDIGDAAKVAGKIRQALCSPFDLTADITVNIDCSIGIAIYPDHGQDEDSLLKSADEAMYTAKIPGNAKVCFAQSAANAQETNDPATGRQSGNRGGNPFVWRQSYQCGEARIDQQHKAISAHCNSIILAIESESMSPDELPETLDMLVNEASEHFQYEESVLSDIAYPGLGAHRRTHRALIDRAKELYRLALARKLPPDDLAVFIERDGYLHHLLVADHEYFPFLRKALQQKRPETP